jgi:hypothetical protein
VERGELRRWSFCLWLGSAEDVERNGHPVFADPTPIEAVFARTRCECFGQRDPILRPIAILHKGANLAFRLASEGDCEAAISKAADGTLEAVR